MKQQPTTDFPIHSAVEWAQSTWRAFHGHAIPGWGYRWGLKFRTPFCSTNWVHRVHLLRVRWGCVHIFLWLWACLHFLMSVWTQDPPLISPALFFNFFSLALIPIPIRKQMNDCYYYLIEINFLCLGSFRSSPATCRCWCRISPFSHLLKNTVKEILYSREKSELIWRLCANIIFTLWTSMWSLR